MADRQAAFPTKKIPHHIENGVTIFVLSLMSILPLMEAVARGIFKTGIAYSTSYVQHLILWICFVSGMITSRENRHLSLSIAVDRLKEPVRGWVVAFTGLISVMVTALLCISSLLFVFTAFGEGQKVGFVPIQLFAVVMPIGFCVMTVRFIFRIPEGIKRWIASILGITLAIGLGWYSLVEFLKIAVDGLLLLLGREQAEGVTLFFQRMQLDPWNPELTFGGVHKLYSVVSALSLPILLLLIVSAVFGTPIFVILGGAALLFFYRTGGQLSSVPDEAYIMLKGENIPAIPLFTLVGFILSESRAGERLVRLFRALLGWMPGGLAVMSVLVCAFFTIFTGASGVTILAIGGLLSFVLVQSRYKKDFSLGLLTSSGSIGLLFFPSIPLIMYGVTAQISIKEMGIGGLLPGLIMVITMCLLGIRYAFKSRVDRITFQPYEIIPTLTESRWEILLPWVVLVSYFTGATTLVETAALAVVYVLIIEVFVHRDIKIRQLPQVFLKCIPIIGGVLIILTAAKGLSFYFVDQQIPTRLVEWFQNAISSKYVFLIMLNLALLVTGCFMDIFSAITVVAPLIIPLGVAYGIHPVHLGIIFLANLELGYLTPPVGINLFLASYRFNEPLSKIYRHILPFFLPRLAAVLLITYVPQFTTWLLQIIRL